MNIVFLDIDGVLNQCQPNCYIDNKCFAVLVKICKDTNSNVVLSSSWRVGFTLFGTCSPHIQKLVDMLAKHNISIVGRTPKRGDRGIEVKEYIRTHNISRYVVLDDDKEEFKDVVPNNLYIVNHKTGLSSKDVVAIERMLGKSM